MTTRKRWKHTTARQVGGDDGYCWAVFHKGAPTPVVNGLTRGEVNHYRERIEKEEEERLARMKQPKPRPAEELPSGGLERQKEILERALDANNTDWVARFALADLYEEAGDQVASDCMRWMARNERRAHNPREGLWNWCDHESADDIESFQKYRSSIPILLWVAAGGRLHDQSTISSDTRRGADLLLLLKGWRKLHAEGKLPSNTDSLSQWAEAWEKENS